MRLVAHRVSDSRRRLALILAAMFAALTMAFAAQARAAPYTAVAWGDNVDGTLGFDFGFSVDATYSAIGSGAPAVASFTRTRSASSPTSFRRSM